MSDKGIRTVGKKQTEKTDAGRQKDSERAEKMPQIRAAFFDVDGTLFSHTTQTIPADALKALQCMQKKGIRIFLATGRHPLELDQLQIEDFSFDGFVVINGQIVLDGNRQIVWQRPFSSSTSKALAALAAEKRFPMSLVEADRFYINYISERVYEAQENISMPLPPVDTWKGAPLFGGVVFLRRDEEHLIRDFLPDDIEMTRWNDFGLDLCEASIGKAAGLKAVGELHGIDPEQMIAFGDSENDLSMLEFAGIGVAMGNAEEKIKAAADYVTAHQDEGGIAQACFHFGLIRSDDLLKGRT